MLLRAHRARGLDGFGVHGLFGRDFAGTDVDDRAGRARRYEPSISWRSLVDSRAGAEHCKPNIKDSKTHFFYCSMLFPMRAVFGTVAEGIGVPKFQLLT